ncbi:MAG: TolC family protein [Aquificae bacterium]|nr:TolC family protein [Aquificota bacterium]
MKVAVLLLLTGALFAGELTLKQAVRDALENNLELKAYRRQVKASEYEYKSVRGLLFPTVKLGETYTKTNIPGYYLVIKMNQERINLPDFNPARLNDPPAINNFETKLSIELPVWMGGKLRAFKNMAKLKWKGDKTNLGRKEEEVVLKVYEAYANAVLAKAAIEAARQAVKDAEEHVRLAEKAHETGVALFADVLRARVYLSKAREKLRQAENNYRVAKEALKLVTNKDYGEFEVKSFTGCPELSKERLLKVALSSREDYAALNYYVRSLKEGVKSARADYLPKLFAFASWYMYDQDQPFSNEGDGYMLGLALTWDFNLGFAPLYKAKSFKEQELALRRRRELLAKAIKFQIEEAFAAYQNALASYESAKARLEEAKEVVRVMKKRYEEGMARMVDLLDAQTQLDMARFELVQALKACNVAYAKALFSAGVLKEEVLK